MANPWTKKNPFLSMWLSGANSVASAARGKVLAESKRQTQAAVNESTRQMMQFWTGGLMKPPAPPRKKRKSR